MKSFCLLISLVSMILFSLIGVAFVTLLERKILGYMQIRIGPNKASLMGITQPLSDAMKLYSKEISKPMKSNFFTFFVAPSVSLMLAMNLWICLPFLKPIFLLNLSLLLFFSILGLGVYPIFLSGWSSNSNYSLLGSMRALAQTISYEVSLIFIVMSSVLLSSSMNLNSLMEVQFFTPLLMFFIMTYMWVLSVLAELNRTPFDFAEGESELVSGFNTEYSSGTFAMIFMSEYMMILFFSFFSVNLFFGVYPQSILTFLFGSYLVFLIMWIRATLPRFRYDKLMDLSWKVILPSSTFNLIFSCCLNIFSKY